jgi:hypothetical protein
VRTTSIKLVIFTSLSHSSHTASILKAYVGGRYVLPPLFPSPHLQNPRDGEFMPFSSKNTQLCSYVCFWNAIEIAVWRVGLLLKRLNNKKMRKTETEKNKDDGYMCLCPSIEDLPAQEFHKKHFHSQEMAVSETPFDQCHDKERIERPKLLCL